MVQRTTTHAQYATLGAKSALAGNCECLEYRHDHSFDWLLLHQRGYTWCGRSRIPEALVYTVRLILNNRILLTSKQKWECTLSLCLTNLMRHYSILVLVWASPVTKSILDVKTNSNKLFKSSGYLVEHSRSDEVKWITTRLPADTRTHTLERLACGTLYKVRLTAYNAVGSSPPSDELVVSTKGGREYNDDSI